MVEGQKQGSSARKGQHQRTETNERQQEHVHVRAGHHQSSSSIDGEITSRQALKVPGDDLRQLMTRRVVVSSIEEVCIKSGGTYVRHLSDDDREAPASGRCSS
jgi:hypothetical protein